MAWEWVSPTATAAVGIAAVGFSYLATRHGENTRSQDSRFSRKHERDLVVRSERLEMFAAYLAAVDAFTALLTEANAVMTRWHKEAHTPSDDLPEVITKMINRMSEMDKHYQAARLVGSTAVSEAGEAVRNDVDDILARIANPHDDWILLQRGPHDALVAAMREDLGNVD